MRRRKNRQRRKDMEKMQKAIILSGPGKWELTQKPVPKIKRSDEVLVKILAASICGTDIHILADPPEYPAKEGVTIGHEIVGEVAEIGECVTSLKKGDRVIMDNNIACGVCDCCRSGNSNVCSNMVSLGMELDGAFAQYCVVSERNLTKINKDVPIDMAIFAEPLNCVMGGFQKLKIMPGDSVLILGGGPIGMYFTKLCHMCGAGRVFVSEVSDARKEFICKSGADRIINPVEENLEDEIRKEYPEGVDIVIDCVGVLIKDALKCVRPAGQVLLFGLNENVSETICQSYITRHGISVKGTFIGNNVMNTVAKGLNSGMLDFRYMITHRLPLDDFGKGLEAMRKGEAVEVVLYPWGEVS